MLKQSTPGGDPGPFKKRAAEARGIGGALTKRKPAKNPKKKGKVSPAAKKPRPREKKRNHPDKQGPLRAGKKPKKFTANRVTEREPVLCKVAPQKRRDKGEHEKLCSHPKKMGIKNLRPVKTEKPTLLRGRGKKGRSPKKERARGKGKIRGQKGERRSWKRAAVRREKPQAIPGGAKKKAEDSGCPDTRRQRHGGGGRPEGSFRRGKRRVKPRRY